MDETARSISCGICLPQVHSLLLHLTVVIPGRSALPPSYHDLNLKVAATTNHPLILDRNVFARHTTMIEPYLEILATVVIRHAIIHRQVQIGPYHQIA